MCSLLSQAKSDYEKEMIIFTFRVAVIKPNSGTVLGKLIMLNK